MHDVAQTLQLHRATFEAENAAFEIIDWGRGRMGPKSMEPEVRIFLSRGGDKEAWNTAI